MVGWEKEKWEELKEKVAPQIEMIKVQVKMIGNELRETEDNYGLDFMCDMQDFLQDVIIENL